MPLLVGDVGSEASGVMRPKDLAPCASACIVSDLIVYANNHSRVRYLEGLHVMVWMIAILSNMH